MVRIEAVCVCVLSLAASGAYSVHAQDDVGDGPGPVDSTQSVSAGADDEISDKSRLEHERGGPANPGQGSGAYAGVVPGAVKQARPPKAPSPKAPLTITWPGFQMRPDGSSRVFVQSNRAMEPKVLKAEDGKFELELPGASIAAKTNRLPLDTRFFNTPVVRVSVTTARSGAIVQLDLRAPVTPQVTSEQGPAGYYFTYIELPKGEYIKPANTGPVVSAPSPALGESSVADHSAATPTSVAAPPRSKVIGKPTSALISGSRHAGSGSGEGRWSSGTSDGKGSTSWTYTDGTGNGLKLTETRPK